MDGAFTPGLQGSGAVYRYYQCVNRSMGRCDAPWLRTEQIEEALAMDLRRLAPDAGLNEALRQRLKRAVDKPPDARKTLKAPLRSLAERESRVKVMFELATIDQAEYVERLAHINDERQAARQEAEAATERLDLRWCEEQIVDLVKAWELASTSQKTALLSTVFDHIEADTRRDQTIELDAIPKAGWRPYFERVVSSAAPSTDSIAQP